MPRPSFELTDDQGRHLARAVDALRLTYPDATGSHRPFCAGFIRAVHAATGKTFGAGTYRNLLKAWAPERRPSTTTLDAERAAFVQELSAQSESAVADIPPPPPGLAIPPAASLESVMRGALVGLLPELATLLARAGKQAEFEYLVARQADLERRLNAAQAHLTDVVLERDSALQRAQMMEADLAAARDALAREQERLTALTQEIHGQRLFALQAIELSRTETRLAKERAADLEMKLARQEMHNDHLKIALSKATEPRT